MSKALVLDANILIRAVLGRRALSLLTSHAARVAYYAPDVCFAEAAKYLPGILASRGEDPDAGMSVLRLLEQLVAPVDRSVYQHLEQPARRRISARDPKDWPVVAVAVLFHLPLWTEDRDFFGSGIATWTTDRVELYFDDQPHRGAAS